MIDYSVLAAHRRVIFLEDSLNLVMTLPVLYDKTGSKWIYTWIKPVPLQCLLPDWNGHAVNSV
jgi:hypothetical protein